MNGRKICKSLREIRLRIANANDIDYTPAVCTHEGDCSGTCPRCESELRYLERQLIRRSAMGKNVALAGLALGAASLMSIQAQQVIPATYDTTIQQPQEPRLIDAAPGDTTAVVVRGRVIDKDDREPIIGAWVYLKGTKLRTATDYYGNFAIRVPKESILIIEYVGFEDKEYKVKKSDAQKDKDIVITIKPKATLTGEVVIVGRGMPAVDADIYMPR